jgi:Ca2+-binding EF-hand superfamily protein
LLHRFPRADASFRGFHSQLRNAQTQFRQNARRFHNSRSSSSAGEFAWSYAKRFPEQHPIIFSTILCCAKCIAADILVQKSIEHRATIDWPRVGAFGAFGAVYMGFCQYFLFVHGLAYLFPAAGKVASMGFREKLTLPVQRILWGQIAVDQMFFAPFLFLPAYYLFHEVILGSSEIRQAKEQTIISSSFAEWKRNIVNDVKGSLSVWVPAGFANFAFVPMHLRVPVMGVISFFYCAFVSYSHGSAAEATPQAEKFIMAFRNLRFGEEGARVTPAMINEVLHAEAITPDAILSKIEFRTLFESFGVKDAEVADMLFEEADVNFDGEVTVYELVNLMVLLNGSGSKFDRLTSIFQAIDLNNDGEISLAELDRTTLSLINLRESLLVWRTENAGSLNPSSQPKARYDETETREVTAARRAQRAKFLKAQNTAFANLNTHQELIEAEAHTLARSIFEHADLNHDQSLTLPEFLTWAEHATTKEKEFFRLFKAFAPH